MEWIESSLNCQFDGVVPPFCFPDSLMGPDCLFFLRKNNDWKDYLLTLCQSKFRTKPSQRKTIRSITSELLYMKNRDDKIASSALRVSNTKRWAELYLRLFHYTSIKKITKRSAGVVISLWNFQPHTKKRRRLVQSPCQIAWKHILFLGIAL